ncbi:unnamed protein product [Pleuronectes platessa]|uniref:Uncharacterized protein n=1 Tax=Pleuronectes platessa TaxID=8262 RepID=A0A9N7TMA4_PLEPL|nr:unnamed protein product [Pleuronectes platessa]
MRVDIPKDNPNMTCQAVPLQAQSMLSNQQDHDPPSRPDATPVLSHRPPPSTRTHHEPPLRSWSTARAQCHGDCRLFHSRGAWWLKALAPTLLLENLGTTSKLEFWERSALAGL